MTSRPSPCGAVRIPYGHGLYFHDTRYLDEKRLHLNGRPMTLLLASADLGDRGTKELTNPELPLEGGAVLRKETIGLHVDTTIDGRVREVLTFRNFDRVPAQVTLPSPTARTSTTCSRCAGTPRSSRDAPRAEGPARDVAAAL